MGGAALLAFLLFLACLYKRRSNQKKKAANPFPDDTSEKRPAVIAGLPPKPTNAQRPASVNYSNSFFTTEANSSMPLLGSGADTGTGTERSFHSGSQLNGAAILDGRSNHVHRPSTTSLAPSFVMGSSTSFAQSHGSHYGQSTNGNHINGHESAAVLAGAYPDVHRTAYYEPHMSPGVDPRSMTAGSVAAAYHSGSAVSTALNSPANALGPHTHAGSSNISSLPLGAAPSDYAAVSEAARTYGILQNAHVSEPSWSSAASPQDASSRRGSHVSMMAMPPAASAQLHDEVDHLQPRRPPAAGLPGFSSNLNTIPGSVAVSELASAEHHSMHSAALSSSGERSIPPRLPSIPASSPLMVQGSNSFAPLTSFPAREAMPAAYNTFSPRLTADPGTGTHQSSDPSNGGTFNSDGTYNTYTGAVKGQLCVVGSSDAYDQGPPTIAEEDGHANDPSRNMSSDSRTGHFWIDNEEQSGLGAAGRRVGRHSPSGSTSSVNKTGSRMIEMLDVDEQPQMPDFLPEANEVPEQTALPPTRPPFWKERSRSAQSITKVFRSSPLLNAGLTPASNDRPSAQTTSSPGVSATASASELTRQRVAEHRHPPSLDLSGFVHSSANPMPESPKADGEADMWRSKSKPTSGLRKWTMKRTPQPGSKGGSAANEVDVDQLFR